MPPKRTHEAYTVKVAAPEVDKGEKYLKWITCVGQSAVQADVYDVLKAFEVTCPATQHAIKKLLNAGPRGAKDTLTDLNEAIVSIERAKQFITQEN